MHIPDNILEVKIDAEYFGFGGESIQQILRVPAITPIPLSGPALRGVVSLSGRIVTVIDLGVLLGSKPIDILAEESRLLTVSVNDEEYALLVERTEDIGAVDTDHYESIDNEDEMIRGFYRHNGHICQILDLDTVCRNVTLEQYIPIVLEDTEHSQSDTEDPTAQQSQRYLFFMLGSERFALHLDMTREILFVPERFTPITDAENEVMGMFTLRDELYATYDLRRAFGFASEEQKEQNRLVIVSHDGRSLALLVDEVLNVRDINMHDLEQLHEQMDDSRIEALYKVDGTITTIIGDMYIRELIHRHHIPQENNVETTDHEGKGEEMVEVVVFGIGNEEYALDIDRVQEIIKYCEITPIPEAPEYIEGMINLRGAVIPILALPERLGFSRRVTEESKILVTTIEGEKIGLFVDEVREILCVEDRHISRSKSDTSLFSEIFNLEEGKRVILKLRESAIIDSQTIQQIQTEEAALV